MNDKRSKTQVVSTPSSGKLENAPMNAPRGNKADAKPVLNQPVSAHLEENLLNLNNEEPNGMEAEPQKTKQTTIQVQKLADERIHEAQKNSMMKKNSVPESRTHSVISGQRNDRIVYDGDK